MEKVFLSGPVYEQLPLSEWEELDLKPHKSRYRIILPICSYIALFLGIVSTAYFLTRPDTTTLTEFPPCEEVQIRREWGALSAPEKQDFIDAVNCMSTIPSDTVPNGTVYDDFAWLHGGIGSWCHRSSSFLPWHRYTLKIYEEALKTKCGFTGVLPYWNWERDWEDLANSPIWDSQTGFGGDGDTSTSLTVGDGHCVTDGPFSGLRPVLYNQSRLTHCLSRGFRDGEFRGRLPSSPFSPENISQILLSRDYKTFVHEVENSVHNIMHLSIGGDFMALTAANDPIFYLHHAQLDHLWWRWQSVFPHRRKKEYNGKHMHNSTGEAHLTDLLLVGGIANDIPVAQVLDTTDGFLCYRYE